MFERRSLPCGGPADGDGGRKIGGSHPLRDSYVRKLGQRPAVDSLHHDRLGRERRHDRIVFDLEQVERAVGHDEAEVRLEASITLAIYRCQQNIPDTELAQTVNAGRHVVGPIWQATLRM